MRARWLLVAGVMLAALLVGSSSQASETTTHSYDALGQSYSWQQGCINFSTLKRQEIGVDKGDLTTIMADYRKNPFVEGQPSLTFRAAYFDPFRKNSLFIFLPTSTDIEIIYVLKKHAIIETFFLSPYTTSRKSTQTAIAAYSCDN